MMRSRREILGVLAALPLALRASRAAADGLLPDVRLRDAWDRAIQLGRYRGMPVLVVYEDKGSAEANAPLKAQLAQLAQGDKYKGTIALVAVADVTGYDYWPIRGFVKDSIRNESKKLGTVIYCDWDASFRNALGLHRGVSNVALYGRSGSLLFSGFGALSLERRTELIDTLRREIEG